MKNAAGCIKFKGRKIKVNAAFDIVLKTRKLFDDDLFNNSEKVQIALEMLIVNKWRIIGLNSQEKSELFDRIADQFITIKGKKSKDKGVYFDFEQDERFIYSSFMMDYGIDLAAQRGRLQWRDYIALFQGLSAKTKIREVMGIRSREIPKPTKYNSEEIKALQDAKRYYALDLSGKLGENTFDEDLGRVTSGLLAQAKQING